MGKQSTDDLLIVSQTILFMQDLKFERVIINMSIFVSKDQYEKACSVDLFDFLAEKHSDMIKIKYNSALLRTDQHVSVKKGYHGYRNFRTGETGNNIDYLMYYLGYSYQDAVLALTGETNYVSTPKPIGFECPQIPESKEIVLPKPLEGGYKNLFAFLAGRKIPSDLIQRLIDTGILYQSAEGNNIVFVNPQGDYCELRGSNNYADHRCKKRTECNRYCAGDHAWCRWMVSCKEYKSDPFHGCRKKQADRFWYFDPCPGQATHCIYVCEAAIDAISLYVIRRKQGLENDKNKSVYVSIGGVANQQTIDRLKRSSKHYPVIIAVDNDAAGQECRSRNPELEYILPKNKDWNEDLQKGDF